MAQEIVNEETRTESELFGEALRRYIEEREWKRIYREISKTV